MTWNICVVSDCEHCTPAHLNNALLYGSNLLWLPSQLSIDLLGCCVILIEDKKLPQEFEFDSEFIRLHDDKEFHKSVFSIKSLDNETAKDFYAKYIRAKRNLNLAYELYETFDKVEVPKEAIICSFKEISKEKSDIFKDNIEIAVSRTHEIFYDLATTSISHAHASIINDAAFEIRTEENWSTYEAAQSLMNAMQRVLLPDVSELSFEQLEVLRDKAKDELEPMRAEMLLLTEDLRKMVGQDYDTNNLAREAENLIATRVEPSVRDLNSRIRSDVKQFGMSVLVDATNAICLMGFGRIFQKSEYIEQGLIDLVNATAEKFPNLPTLKADTASSRFVIEIQNGMKKQA